MMQHILRTCLSCVRETNIFSPRKPVLPLSFLPRQPTLSGYRSLLLILILSMTVLLAACGGGDDAPANSEAANQEEQGAAEEETTQDETAADVPVGGEEFGLTPEELLQTIDDTEAQIARCMNEAGFEYVAVDGNTIRDAMSADKSIPGLSEEQFYNQYGLGISTLYTGEPPQLSDTATPATMGLGEQNIAIFQRLSPTDQVAYNQTLLGEHADAPLAVALEREDFSRTGGCTRAAIEQVFPAEKVRVSYINPKDYAIDNDERVVAALAEYGECVKEAGFDISEPNDIRPMITERLDEITGGAPVSALSAEAQAALAELQEFERAIATSSFDCEAEYVEPVKEEVEEELFG